jgi:hypothetical protein
MPTPRHCRAGRSRKASASFGTPAIVSIRELAAVYHQYRTGYVKTLHLRCATPAHPPIGRGAHFCTSSFEVFGSGYIGEGDFWKFGLIFGLIYFAGLLVIVRPWQQVIGS